MSSIVDKFNTKYKERVEYETKIEKEKTENERIEKIRLEDEKNKIIHNCVNKLKNIILHDICNGYTHFTRFELMSDPCKISYARVGSYDITYSPKDYNITYNKIVEKLNNEFEPKNIGFTPAPIITPDNSGISWYLPTNKLIPYN